MTTDNLRIVHIVSSIESEAAGPSVSVPRLAEAQARLGAHVKIVTVGDRSRPHPVRTSVPHSLCARDAAGVPILSALWLSGEMYSFLNERPSSFDVVHSHGLWLAPNVYPAAAAKNGALWVVSPRGMLGAPALKFSAWKKRAFWTVAQRPALRWASLMHATSYEEARAIKQAGIIAPVTVVPNGVTLPPTSWANTVSRRTILSLGRIHPKKGLGRLVEAWSAIEDRFPDWHVRIIGPDERDHAAELIAQIGRLGISRITVEGPLFGEEKEAVYREAGIFVLPTQNENFGLTVAEALAAETPVISSKGAPWSGLETHDCGRWVEHGTEPLAAALVDLLEMDDLQRSEMGVRGREWMKAEFSWDSIGTSLLAAYRLALTSRRMRQQGLNGETAHDI